MGTLLLEIEADHLLSGHSAPGIYALQMILKEMRDGRPRLVDQGHLLRQGRSFLLAAIEIAAVECDFLIACRTPGTGLVVEPLSTEHLRVQLSTIAEDEPRYPIVFWLVPAASPDCEAAVREWGVDPGSEILLRAALQAGGIWVSIADVFLDVLISRSQGSALLGWLSSAVPRSTLPIRWQE